MFEWHKSIINAGIFKVYDLKDILKKCNELNLWSLFERLLESNDIKIIIENQLDIEKKPLIYFIDILRSYKLYDEIKSLLYREPFMLNQFKSGNVSLKEIINDYVYLKDKSPLKSILQELNYSAIDFKNNGLSLKDVLKYTQYDQKASKILEKGYTLQDLVESKYFSYFKLRSEFKSTELRHAGFTIKDYIAESYYKYLSNNNYTELIQAGYTAYEFKESGYAKLSELKKYFTLEKIAEVYSFEELSKVYSCIELSEKFKLDQLLTVCPLDEIFASGKYKYDDIKQFNKGDNKKLDNLLKECKKNFLRKTNLECIYDPVKKIATNPTERYPK